MKTEDDIRMCHLSQVCPTCRRVDGHAPYCELTGFRGPYIDPDEVAARYNTREIVEAVRDVMKSEDYERNEYTSFVKRLCREWDRSGNLSEKQFRAMAVHIAVHESALHEQEF